MKHIKLLSSVKQKSTPSPLLLFTESSLFLGRQSWLHIIINFVLIYFNFSLRTLCVPRFLIHPHYLLLLLPRHLTFPSQLQVISQSTVNPIYAVCTLIHMGQFNGARATHLGPHPWRNRLSLPHRTSSANSVSASAGATGVLCTSTMELWLLEIMHPHASNYCFFEFLHATAMNAQKILFHSTLPNFWFLQSFSPLFCNDQRNRCDTDVIFLAEHSILAFFVVVEFPFHTVKTNECLIHFSTVEPQWGNLLYFKLTISNLDHVLMVEIIKVKLVDENMNINYLWVLLWQEILTNILSRFLKMNYDHNWLG